MTLSKIPKTQLQIDVETYKKLAEMRRFYDPSKIKREPVRNVVQRLLEFYIENGGIELEAEYRDSISQ